MKHTLAFIFALFTILTSSAQTKEYLYSSDFSPVKDFEKAVYKKIVKGNINKHIKITTLKKEGEEWTTLKKENIKYLSDNEYRIKYTGENIVPRTIHRTYQRQEDDLFTFSDWKNGNIVQKGTASSIVPLHFTDTIWTYYEADKLKSISVYENNRLVSNKNWLKSGKLYIEDIHFFVDNTPEHEMGQINFRNYIISGIKEAGIDISQVADRVVIGWVVMEDGSCEGFHSTAGVYSNLKAVLIKLLMEMPGEWEPASLNGAKVRYYMSIPFNFIDQSDNFDSLDFSSGFLVWD